MIVRLRNKRNHVNLFSFVLTEIRIILPIYPLLTYSSARAVPKAILTREFQVNGLL